MNKKIAMSAMSIMSALTIMGGATFAAFTSEAQNEGNTFGSGELVLQINGAAGNASTPVFDVQAGTNTSIFFADAAAPGDSVEASWLLTNTGSTDAEPILLDQIDLGGDTVLAGVLTLEIFRDDGDNSGELGGDDVLIHSAHLDSPTWNDLTLTGVALPASGGDQRIYARLTFDASADNTYQNKNLVFNVDFRADQDVTP